MNSNAESNRVPDAKTESISVSRIPLYLNYKPFRSLFRQLVIKMIIMALSGQPGRLALFSTGTVVNSLVFVSALARRDYLNLIFVLNRSLSLGAKKICRE